MDEAPGRGTVFVIDDDDALRDSVCQLVEVHGFQVRAFANARAFLECAPDLSRGCILLDIRLPDLSGLEVMMEMKGLGVKFPTIIMTAYADVALAVKAMKAGAIDFIEKPFREETLLESIHAALALGAESVRQQLQNEEIASRLDRLTPREKQVLMMVVAGEQNKHIARVLGISPRTVEIHRSRVMEKTKARNLSDLIRMTLAIDLGDGVIARDD